MVISFDILIMAAGENRPARRRLQRLVRWFHGSFFWALLTSVLDKATLKNCRDWSR